MPLYSFKNKKTGKMWDEILSFKEREELLKDKNIEQIITAPMLAFIERPLSATFIFLSLLFFVWPLVGLLRSSKQEHPHFSSKRPDFSKQNS